VILKYLERRKGQIRLGPVPCNLLVANVTKKSLTSYRLKCYEKVGHVGRVASLLWGSYEEVSDFQTISTC